MNFSFGQNDKTNYTKLYDADSTCFGVIFQSNSEIDSTLYYNLEGKKIAVNFEIPKYKYGIDSLNNFVLKEFRRKLEFVEVNGAALVFPWNPLAHLLKKPSMPTSLKQGTPNLMDLILTRATPW